MRWYISTRFTWYIIVHLTTTVLRLIRLWYNTRIYIISPPNLPPIQVCQLSVRRRWCAAWKTENVSVKMFYIIILYSSTRLVLLGTYVTALCDDPPPPTTHRHTATPLVRNSGITVLFFYAPLRIRRHLILTREKSFRRLVSELFVRGFIFRYHFFSPHFHDTVDAHRRAE